MRRTQERSLHLRSSAPTVCAAPPRYVNNSGERFCAEKFEVPTEILAQDKGEVYAIFDADN